MNVVFESVREIRFLAGEARLNITPLAGGDVSNDPMLHLEIDGERLPPISLSIPDSTNRP